MTKTKDGDEQEQLLHLVFGGEPVGRVMDGSFHFLPPTTNASDALVFAFGYQALPSGIAHISTPAYYSLAAVSDPLPRSNSIRLMY